MAIRPLTDADMADSQPISASKGLTDADMADSVPANQNWLDKLKSGFNQPSIPLKQWGGKALDTVAQVTGMGQDRTAFKQQFPATYGTLKSVAGKTEQLTSPMNVGIGLGMAAAGPEIATGAAGLFAVQGLTNLFKQAPQKYQEYQQAITNNDSEKQAEILTDAGIDTAMTGVAAKAFTSGVGAFRSRPKVAETTESLIQNQYPQEVSPAQTGQTLQQDFNKQYAPQEAQVQSEFETNKSLVQKNYENELYKQQQAQSDARAQAQFQNERNQNQYQTELENQKKAFEDSQANKIQQATNASKIQTGRIGVREQITPTEAGQAIPEDINNTLAKEYETSKQLYGKLGEKMGDSKAIPVEDRQGLDIINNIFQQRGIEVKPKEISPTQSLIESQVAKQYKSDIVEKHGMDMWNIVKNRVGLGQTDLSDVVNKMDEVKTGKLTSASLGEKTLNAYKFMNDMQTKLSNPYLTAQELSQIRTDAASYANSGIETPIKRAYKAVVGGLTDDINRTADINGYSAISKGARGHYKGLKDFEESDIVQAAQSKDPSQILNYAIKTPERAGRLMDSVSPQTQDTIQSGLLDKIHESATDKATGQIDPGKIETAINKIPDETLKAVYGEKFPIIDTYRKYSNALDNSDFFKPTIEKPELVKPAYSSNLQLPIAKQALENMGNKSPELPNAGIAEMVRGEQPSALVQTIMRDGKVENLRSLMGTLSPEGQDTLKSGVWSQIIRNSKDTSGKLDLGKYASEIQGIESKSEGWLKTLLGNNDYKVVDALKKIADYSKENQSNSHWVMDLARAALYKMPGLKLMYGGRAASKIGANLMGGSKIGDIINETGAQSLTPAYSVPPSNIGSNLVSQGLVRPPLNNNDKKGLAKGLKK